MKRSSEAHEPSYHRSDFAIHKCVHEARRSRRLRARLRAYDGGREGETCCIVPNTRNGFGWV